MLQFTVIIYIMLLSIHTVLFSFMLCYLDLLRSHVIQNAGFWRTVEP